MSERPDLAPLALSPLVPEEDTVRRPLSVGQQGLWFIHRSDPGSAAYNTMLAVRISTPLDEFLLRQAVSVVVRRHEMLRSAFTEGSGRPWRVVGTPDSDDGASLTVHEVHGMGDDEAHERIGELGREPFHLTEGERAFRVHLLRRGHDVSDLVLVAHHIVIDATSLYLVLGELLTRYRGLEEGLPVVSQVQPSADEGTFVTAERELIDSPRGARQREYWRGVCTGAVAAELPADRTGRAASGSTGATHMLHTPTHFLQQVTSAAAHARTTPFIYLLAAFQACLHRHTRQEDFLVGVPVATRRTPALREAVGYLVNSLPIRSGCTESTTFADMVGSARQRMTHGLANMDFPFPLMVEEFRGGAEQRRAPLFRVTFSMLPVDRMEPALPMPDKGKVEGASAAYAGHRVSFLDLPQQEGQFDLAVELRYGAGSLSGAFRYDSERFDASTIEGLAKRFVRFAKLAATKPDTRVHEASLLDSGEAARLLAFGQA